MLSTKLIKGKTMAKEPTKVTDKQYAKWLDVALAQRKRALQTFIKQYGEVSPATRMIGEEINILQNEIARLEKE